MRTLMSIAAILFLSTVALGQVNFRTGDAALDAELNGINNDAKKDLSAFKDLLLSEHNIIGTKADELLQIMEPAEILLSGRLKDLLDISIDVVIGSYEKNKDKGWGAIAKDLGIKPGSPEFHALKGKPKNSKAGGKGNGKGNSKVNSLEKGKAKS